MSQPSDQVTVSTVVFRNSPLTLLAIMSLAICVTPVALGAPWFWLFYLVPLGLAAWVLRVRTTAGPDVLVVRGALRATRVPWTDVAALRLRSTRTRSQVSAVLSDGSQLTLPAVHVRDLPLLAAVSGGRLPDPSAKPTERPPAEPTQTEPTQTEPAQPEARPARSNRTPPKPAQTEPAPHEE